jgi:hypothetical protein
MEEFHSRPPSLLWLDFWGLCFFRACGWSSDFDDRHLVDSKSRLHSPVSISCYIWTDFVWTLLLILSLGSRAILTDKLSYT